MALKLPTLHEVVDVVGITGHVVLEDVTAQVRAKEVRQQVRGSAVGQGARW